MLEQFEADVAGAESDLPVSFTFEGKQYVGQKFPRNESQAMVDAGFIPRSDIDLLVRRSQFGPEGEPIKDSEITVSGKDYRVDKFTDYQDGICLLLSLVLLT